MCTSPIPLVGYSDTHCDLPDGHDGAHGADAWGPRITWRDDDPTSVRSAA